MAEDKTPKGDINFEHNQGVTGLNMDNIPSQIDKGSLSYALNAALENFDNNSVTYQNEPGTEFCLNFPHNYVVVGRYLIPEISKQIFFLANPITGGSEIGYVLNNDCVYHTLINDNCLGFDVDHPIHKVVHKTNNCGTEIYWAQANQDRRFLNLDNIPYIAQEGSTPCNSSPTNKLDCNQLRVQPTYSTPQLFVRDVINGGNLIAGTYQFALQYSDAGGNPLSSYHSVTNPTPIADTQLTTVNFNYPVGKSIVVDISNIETAGQFGYFNLAVIKTINDITSVELVGTFSIEGTDKTITYSGQNQTQIRLTINDIFEQFPFYGPADDVTTAQDVLIWKGLSAPQRVNYQKIANQITLLWQSYKMPANENYADEINATNLRSYLRDEVYPFEIVFQLTSGRETDAFHIPGRRLTLAEAGLPMINPSNNDFIEDPDLGPQPYWKIYNTAQVIGDALGPKINNATPYKYGIFAYWESTDTYSCDEDMWGELAGQPIRHHKFPDVEISPIIDSKPYSSGDPLVMGNVSVFPIGVKVDTAQIRFLIENSTLTAEQKADIVGYKIVRGDRTDNRSIVAKGMLRNVNKYTREQQDYYYPNYPYNDLNDDPFIMEQNNAFAEECQPFTITINNLNTPANGSIPAHTTIQYTDCNSGKTATKVYETTGVHPTLCSIGKPIVLGNTTYTIFVPPFNFPEQTPVANIGYASYEVWRIIAPCPGVEFRYNDYINGITTFNTTFGTSLKHIKVVPGSLPLCINNCDCPYSLTRVPSQDVKVTTCGVNVPLSFKTADDSLRTRQIFNSPETSFGQPFLGDILKLESVMFGGGKAHFVEVKDNAKYRLLTKEAQQDALNSSGDIGGGDAAAIFTAYQAYLEIYINGITRKNYAYSFNSIADYNYSVSVPDDQEIKQRRIDLKKYLIPAIQAVGDGNIDINNYQRETSVYIKTDDAQTPLPFPHLSPNMTPTGVTDVSRFIIGCRETPPCAIIGTTTTTTTSSGFNYCPGSCAEPEKQHDIRVVSYYASLKNTFRNQWGQLYSYQTIDTGFQVSFSSSEPQPETVFGGDTFICRFAYKTKVPFFIDNRVGAPDDSEIFYDELGNIGYPRFWHSARSILQDWAVAGNNMVNIISYKAHNFDCPNCQTVPASDPNRTFYDGYFYLFAYGIPNFYCESSYNVDLRQAFNNKEGDFWPHVSSGIPDNWVQESFVSIANDNTYNYNVTYSKQNKETFYSHIPFGFDFTQPCQNIYPFRAIFSDPQVSTTNTLVNNWLTYRASSYFDFPQNYGKLTSLDGIDNRQVLARFENKSLLYNALYTTQTSPGGQVYLGQSLFSRNAPPWDYGETDLGYVGSQHKFLLKIPQGQISIDAKRGQVFLLGGQNAKDLSAPGSGMNRFFTDHLAFEILRFFPDVNIDNNFNGIGLHGVYDSKYDRVIITKLDYIPLSKDIKYDSELNEFYIEEDIPDSTTTTTSSSTTTTTTTVAPEVFTRLLTSIPRATAIAACGDSTFDLLLYIEDDFVIPGTTVFYTNPTLTTPFNGGSQWFKWGFTAFQINSSGLTINLAAC